MHIFDASLLSMVSCNRNDITSLQFLGRAYRGGKKDLLLTIRMNTKALGELKDIVNKHLPEEEEL